MEIVSDWLNRTEFERFLKAKFYRIVDPNGSELYDQLEARKYPFITADGGRLALKLRMLTNGK